MHILLYTTARLPVINYGGTERVIWDLAEALTQAGHKVTLLAGTGSVCPWADVIIYQSGQPLEAQIPSSVDLVHFHSSLEPISKPYIYTQHGNVQLEAGRAHQFDPNTVFVSQQHALNHGGQAFVHNGLNWDNYQKPDLGTPRNHFHFLGKAAWRVKNVQGAIDITKAARVKLEVLGGYRFNFKMGLRLTFDSHVRFCGMVNDEQKSHSMNGSRGLIFPVKWHEPFGLAITESLYFGCPVFATPYGSLPELVLPEFGLLSNKQSELIEAVKHADDFSRKDCHEYALERFNAQIMAQKYLDYYEKALNHQALNHFESMAPILLSKLAYHKDQ